MSPEVPRKHKFINNQFLEKILREFHKDETIFLKTFEILSISSRDESYWNDQINILVNYTNSNNQLK